MDGVLADFDGKMIELFGKTFKDFPSRLDGWVEVEKHQNFYAILEPMKDAKYLMAGVLQLAEDFGCRVEVLTAIPKIGRLPLAKAHKREWMAAQWPGMFVPFNIGPHAEHKQYHCQAGDVLVDDMSRNIHQWNGQGGYGIMHTSAADTLEKLYEYLQGKQK